MLKGQLWAEFIVNANSFRRMSFLMEAPIPQELVKKDP